MADLEIQKYYFVTMPFTYYTDEVETLLLQHTITIMQRWTTKDCYICEVENINLAKKCELVTDTKPYTQEPYITYKTKNLTEDKLIKFTVVLHKLDDKPSLIKKLEMLGLEYECCSYEYSRSIYIHLTYPEQKDLVNKINEFKEVYRVEEKGIPTLCSFPLALKIE